MGALSANTNVEQVCEDNKDLVCKVINKHFPGYRFDDDFFQEAWIGLWEAQLSFDEDRGIPFGAYASKVIKNRCFDEIKRRSRIKRLPIDSLDQPFEDSTLTYLDVIPDNEDAIGDALSEIDVDDLLNTIRFSGLSETDISVLDCKVSGQTWTQISESVGICTSRVNKSIKAIRKAFTTLYNL